MPTPEDKSLKDDASQHGPAHQRSMELESIAARLAQLSPRGDRLNRERLIFLAGQASVAAGSNDQTTVADWRRHPAWPSAFAAMSALAATLLAILITRPSVTSDVPTASRHPTPAKRFVSLPQPERSAAQNGRAGTLSARDARYGDIEALLTARSEDRAPWPVDIEQQPHPILTPSAWQEVVDEMQPLSSPAGSSNLILFRGVNS